MAEYRKENNMINFRSKKNKRILSAVIIIILIIAMVVPMVFAMIP